MTLTDESPMPFGKHKGTAMGNVPAEYLLWMWRKQGTTKPFGRKAQAVMDYITENLECLKWEVGNNS